MENQEKYIECVECHEEIEPIGAYQYVVKGVLVRPLCGICCERYRRQELSAYQTIKADQK